MDKIILMKEGGGIIALFIAVDILCYVIRPEVRFFYFLPFITMELLFVGLYALGHSASSEK